MRLKSVLLPTFGRPTTATIGIIVASGASRAHSLLRALGARGGGAVGSALAEADLRPLRRGIVAELGQHARRVSPAWRDAHEELEVHLASEQRLDALSRPDADVRMVVPPVPTRIFRWPGFSTCSVARIRTSSGASMNSFDGDRDRVRYLGARRVKHAFAHVFAGEERGRAIGEGVVGVAGLALGRRLRRAHRPGAADRSDRAG